MNVMMFLFHWFSSVFTASHTSLWFPHILYCNPLYKVFVYIEMNNLFQCLCSGNMKQKYYKDKFSLAIIINSRSGRQMMTFLMMSLKILVDGILG